MKKLLACGLILSTLMSFGSVCFAAGIHEADLICDVIEQENYGATIEYDNSFRFAYKSAIPNFMIKNLKLYEDSFSCTKIFMKGDYVYDIICATGGIGYFSLMGYNHNVSFEYDIKDRNMICCEEYMNIGDGVWHKISQYGDPMNAQSSWSVDTIIRSKYQYKYVITFEDGNSEEVKFFGSELLEADNGELDMGVLCLKNIFLEPQNNSHIRLEVERIDEDEDDDNYDYYSINSTESQDCTETKKPRSPRKDKEESSSIDLQYKKELTNLRNKAMDFLHSYHEYGQEDLEYSCRAISEMEIGDLNENFTVLTVNSKIKRLPACVVEALRDYLAQREKLAPSTMGDEKPLFIDCRSAQRIKQGSKLVAGSVKGGISEYRKANGQIADMEE